MPKRINRAAARNCLLINQLATPGLGSLMAGRWLAGAGQLLLALAGAGLFCAWSLVQARSMLALIQGTETSDSQAGLALSGVAVFAIAWVWALITSLSLIRQAKLDAQAEVNLPPPKL